MHQARCDKTSYMIIAVDFDGTIVEHKYPEIGKEIPFATATLRQLMADGHKLVLWSVREGKLLDEAVAWCEQRGVRFYAVNADLDEDAADKQGTAHFSRKIKAHVFIDDRNIGGLPDWGAIYQLISKRISYAEFLTRQLHDGEGKKKKHWWNL